MSARALDGVRSSACTSRVMVSVCVGRALDRVRSSVCTYRVMVFFWQSFGKSKVVRVHLQSDGLSARALDGVRSSVCTGRVTVFV